MGTNTQSAGDDTDDAEKPLIDARVEAIASGSSSEPAPPDHASADERGGVLAFTRRLSQRGKLTRALIVTLALLVALLALLPHPTLSLLPALARLLTPAPTPTPVPGAFTTGSWDEVPGPPIPAGNYYELTPSLHDPATAYACTMLVSAAAPAGARGSDAALWLTRDAGQTWRRALLPPTPAPLAWSPQRSTARRA
jgi:hypothetical protein